MKILGLGNALVDILVKIDNDKFIQELGFTKGSMQHVDINTSNKILSILSDYNTIQIAGGSAANTINGLACLGISTGFIGKTGEDDLSDFFAKDIINNHINNHLQISKIGTGRVISFITPDGERTFATYLGAAIELGAADLLEKYFAEYDLLHIEGYLVQNHELMLRAMDLAKQFGLNISLDLASFNVVEQNIDFLQNIIDKYVDIVFANEEEAKAFTGCEPEEALLKIAEKCKIAIVKVGKKGSLISSEGETYKVGIINAAAIDTTGAGDLYAAGFLYGITSGKNMEQCGKIGAILSGNVVEVLGAKIPADRWAEIDIEIQKV